MLADYLIKTCTGAGGLRLRGQVLRPDNWKVERGGSVGGENQGIFSI